MNFKKLDAIFEQLKKDNVPHGSLFVCYKGKPVYEKIFDLKKDNKTPINNDAPFFIYSSTKVITAVAAMQLVERGQLDLSAPVSNYISEFEHSYIGKKRVQAKKKITIENLLSMTSGYSYDLEKENLKNVIQDKNASTLKIIKAMAKDYIDFEPGTKFLYGFGLDIIGAVIEKVSNMKFSDYLEENIFQPLGMKNTTFKLTEEIKEKMWDQYSFDEKTGEFNIIPKENRFILTNEFEGGGAGLISTVNDYAKFVTALANYGVAENGYRLLKKESINNMRTNRLVTEEMLKDYWKDGYGYGLGVRTLIDKKTSKSPIGEFGWDSAGFAYSLIDVENNLGIFYGSQILGWNPGFQLHLKIRDLVYNCLKG